MHRPETGEFASFYANYISLIKDEDVLSVLGGQIDELNGLIAGLPESKGSYAYAPGKWTLKELLSHLIDGERIFSYRILRISRGDTTPLAGFEQDDYIERSNANNRSFSELLEEFELQRRSNLLLFGNLDDEASKMMGTASEKTVSVRALVYVMAGHVRHHLGVLKERYLA